MSKLATVLFPKYTASQNIKTKVHSYIIRDEAQTQHSADFEQLNSKINSLRKDLQNPKPEVLDYNEEDKEHISKLNAY